MRLPQSIIIELDHLKDQLAYHYKHHTYAIWQNRTLYRPLSDVPLAKYRVVRPGVYALYTGPCDEDTGTLPHEWKIEADTMRDLMDAADAVLHTPDMTYHSETIGQYEHYKGDVYELTGMGWDTELNIPTYDYNTAGDFTTFHRPAHMWGEDIQGESTDNPPEPVTVRRFLLLEI